MKTSGPFLDRYPAYLTTSALDDLRALEYARLDAQGIVYLDYTGGGLHADSQVRLHADLLAQNVFGNPHSASPSSTAMTDAVERARDKVLDYFNGAGDYTAVFTLNASGALKLVGESYPFEPGGRLLLTVDNHNSVNGIREFARARGAEVDYTPLTVPELRIEDTALLAHLDQADRARPNLFAFPAQSNFSGVKHPLALIDTAHERAARVLVDVYHSLGVLPVDVAALGVDFAVGGSYKYLRGGPGACFLYMHPRHLDGSLTTLDTGWFAKRDAYQRPDPPQWGDGGDAFLESTPPVLTWYQARAGQILTLALGVERLRAYSLAQQRRLMDLLHERDVHASGSNADHGAFCVVSFASHAEGAATRCAQGLAARGLACDARGPWLRLCPDILTSDDELKRAAAIVGDVIGA